MGIVYVGSASIDERGRATGGEAGNQGGELKRRKWYQHSKGWRVFRPNDSGSARLIAECMERAIKNGNIGYDQNERNTLYRLAREVGFDCARVSQKCETDCSALVRVCCAYAGIPLADFNTASEPAVLLSSGRFTELKGSAYTTSSSRLRKGDILVTASKGHTEVVLTDGDLAGADPREEQPKEEPRVAVKLRELARGRTGKDVRSAQRLLLQLGYDLGSWGADGDFGQCTESAVEDFQRYHGLAADGVIGENTWRVLIEG